MSTRFISILYIYLKITLDCNKMQNLMGESIYQTLNLFLGRVISGNEGNYKNKHKNGWVTILLSPGTSRFFLETANFNHLMLALGRSNTYIKQ